MGSKKKKPATAAARKKKMEAKAAQREADRERREAIYDALEKQPLVPTGHAMFTAAGERFVIGQVLPWLPEAGKVTSISPVWARMPDRPTPPGEKNKQGLIETVNARGEEVPKWCSELVVRVYHEGPYFHDIWPDSGTRITAKLVPETKEIEGVSRSAIDDIESTRTDAGDSREPETATEEGGTPLSSDEVEELLEDLTRKDDFDGAKMIQRMARKGIGSMSTEQEVIAEVENARAALTPDTEED